MPIGESGDRKKQPVHGCKGEVRWLGINYPRRVRVYLLKITLVAFDLLERFLDF